MIAPTSRPVALAALALAVGCRSPAPELPPGAGLRAADRAAPAGVETFERPAWTAGDELRYRRGARLPLAFVVGGTPEAPTLVETRGGRELVLDRDLARLGERPAGDEELESVFDPLDPAYDWPLWPGKRWTGEFVLRPDRGRDLPIEARYHCDAIEEVTVPAGTYRCLRIWRRDQVALEGNFVERVTIDWYAPELGHMVRRVEDGLETVLVDAMVQAATPSADPAPGAGTGDDG